MIRTAKLMGLRTIAVYSEVDAALPFVAEADEAVLIGPANPAESYSNVERCWRPRRPPVRRRSIPGTGFCRRTQTLPGPWSRPA